MYLFVEAEIDGQKFEFTSQVMGTSKASNICYTLYPTTVFLVDDEITCLTIEETFSGEKNLCFKNETGNYFSDVQVLSVRKVTLS